MSGGQALAFSLQVAVIGMGIVFVALICLVFLFKLMSLIVKAVARRKDEKGSEEPQMIETPSAPSVSSIIAQPAEDEDEIAAVIAAVLAVCQDKVGLVVRSVRRVGKNVPDWNIAGRRENG